MPNHISKGKSTFNLKKHEKIVLNRLFRLATIAKMNSDKTEIQTIGFDDDDETSEPLWIGLTILFHPDISRIGDIASLAEVGKRSRFQLSRLEPGFTTVDGTNTGPLESPFVSRTPMGFELDPNGVTLQCPSGKETGMFVNGDPCPGGCYFSLDALEEGVVLRLSDAVVLLLHYFDSGVQNPPDTLGIVGQNRMMQHLRSEILSVADLDVPVLIRGETGTGKELVASAIQVHSRRANKAFEKVNLAEIPVTIAERELFGAERHAGTGEPGHGGYFVRADGGTLFLDEIGDVDPAVQPKLLRAVETNEIQILGAKKKRRVDVRLIAGTDADLEAAVESGLFKSSLLKRLDAYTLFLPPLRKRRDDIGILFIRFLKQALEALGDLHKLSSPPAGKPSWLPAVFVDRLARYAWPGNVRELKNVAVKIAIGNRRYRQFHIDDRFEQMLCRGAMHSRVQSSPWDLDTMTREDIVAVLEINRFNITRCARYLNVNRSKLHRFLSAREVDVKALQAAASRGET
jgi:two-component system, NtrC family, nitrogen regulation response regulator GlnG